MPNQNDPTQKSSPAESAIVPPVPPSIFPQSDLPPLPPAFSTVAEPAPAAPSPGGGNSSSSPPDISSVISKPKKKFGGGKIIATILGLIVLVGGIGAGILLTQQQQLFKQKAATVDCGVHPDGSPWRCDTSIEVCCISGCKNIADGGCGSTGAKRCNTASNTDEYCRGQYEGFTYCSCLENCSAPGCCNNSEGKGFIRSCRANESTGNNQYRCDNLVTGTLCTNQHASPTPNPTASPTPPATPTHTPTATPTHSPTATPTHTPTPTPSPTPPPPLACNAVCTTDIQCGGSVIPPDSTSPRICYKGSPPASSGFCRNLFCPTQTNCICPTSIPPAPSCIAVKTYDSTWTFIPNAQLPSLIAGDTVSFCVNGTAASGTFDKAQFMINTTLEPETIEKRPGSNDFCQSYTILPTDTTMSIRAKIYHSSGVWVGEGI